MTRTLYVPLTGQADNVGDVVLRRRLVQAVAPLGRLVVLVERADDDYVAGLRLPPGSVVHTSFLPWVRAATAGAAGRGPAALVLNAGEIASSRSQGRRAVLTLPAVLAGRLRGTPTVRAGLGARDRIVPWGLAHQAVVSAATLNVWRDHESRRLYHHGWVAPDWAFDDADSRPADGPRPVLALGFRGDRPAPSPAALGHVRDWAGSRGLRPVVVSQVASDVERNEQVAAALGCEHVGDRHVDLAERERAARDVYRSAAVVASNRVHALIIGFTEGASPAGLVPTPDVKIGRTLDAAGLPPCVLDAPASGTAEVRGFLDGALTHGAGLATVRERAAGWVREMEDAVRASVVDGRATGGRRSTGAVTGVAA
ncbi:MULTISPECIES: hypothetical protein [Cellulomonas]|uniref:Polysaccharide pyruvyl transferase domain-containing protein n=1 Tax=Cellulomonas iranensis TaxID=76862 RepID=A0ABU0GJ27_9CELL|nr:MULTISPECIES: hypothetical protein [Cellulomonas]MDQ0424600.1 hypothetical protein [Cellulomonas iranensis]TFH70659.1 hypothetical protein E4A51_12960 [Cellulomonas sp. HD19AZ1]